MTFRFPKHLLTWTLTASLVFLCWNGNAEEAPAKQKTWAEKTSEYSMVHMEGIRDGPPSPRVGPDEPFTAEDLIGGWVPVTVELNDSQEMKVFNNPDDALLDINAVNGRGRKVFDLIQLNEFDLFKEKFLPPDELYTGMVNQFGINVTPGLSQQLLEHLDADFQARILLYKDATYLGPVKRQDRLDMVVVGDMIRHAHWTFAYKTADGETKEECLHLALVFQEWWLMDVGCDAIPWEDTPH
jgi:hypothetical protein